MSVGGVEHHSVGMHAYQALHVFEAVGVDADGRCNAEPAQAVLAGLGIILDLGDVAIGDESDQPVRRVDHRKLLDAVFPEHLGCLGNRGLGADGDEVLACHDFADRRRRVVLEAQVAVGDDSDQVLPGIDHGDAAYMVLRHETECVAHGGVDVDRDWIVDHAVFRPLYLPDVFHLCLDGHILVYNADATLAGDGDCQVCVGHSIHCSRNDRHRERNLACKLSLDVDFPGKNFGTGRNEQYVVVRQTLHDNLVGIHRVHFRI